VLKEAEFISNKARYHYTIWCANILGNNLSLYISRLIGIYVVDFLISFLPCIKLLYCRDVIIYRNNLLAHLSTLLFTVVKGGVEAH
jgi:hypothetical protein